MKNLLLLAIVILGFTVSSYAQAPEATASASATLVSPLTITKTQDLDFATVAGSSSASTIVMSTAGVLTPSTGAYVISGTAKPAIFHVTGEEDESISITLPGEITLTAAGGSDDVTVGTWQDSEGTDGSATIGDGGVLDISVAGTLNLPENVIKGNYSNTNDLTVTVNYN